MSKLLSSAQDLSSSARTLKVWRVIMEQTRRQLALLRAGGELCNPYFETVCVEKRCKILIFIEFKIQATWPEIPGMNE